MFSCICNMFFLLHTAVQKLLLKNELFRSYDHKCTATFFTVYINSCNKIPLHIVNRQVKNFNRFYFSHENCIRQQITSCTVGLFLRNQKPELS